jgi:tetratricopeptide (TPR) repeat protein
MDDTGALHNLKPIARLNVAGPDQQPRQGDTEFGGKWFTAPPPEPAQPGSEAEGAVVNPEEAHPEDGGPPATTSLAPGPEPVLPAASAEKPVEGPPALSAADLDAIRWRLDGGTLREVVDDKEALRALGEKIDGPLAKEVDNISKAGMLSVRAEVYRLLGELGMAAAASRLALAAAESARHVQSIVIAEAELAHILRLRGEFEEADRLFAKASAAPVPEVLRSVVHENAGRCCFDQGRHMEALDHFARAVRLGRPDDEELAERIGMCLEAVYIHVLRDGWGPYPRQPKEIFGRGALDEVTAEQQVVRPRGQ